MATRKVSTVFAVEGEAAYRQAVANINRELKTLNSSFSLVTSEFANNANSMAALEAKSAALNAVYDKQAQKVSELANALQNAQAAVDKYAARQDELKTALAANETEQSRIANTAEGTIDAYEKLIKQNTELQNSLASNGAKLQAAANGVQDWQTKLNSAQIALNETSNELEKTNSYLYEAKNSTDGYATSIDSAGEEIKQFGEDGTQAMTAVASAVAAAGLDQAFDKVVEALSECTSIAIEFESAFTGVYKTIDGTSEQLADITQGIKDLALEIPLTTTELAGIAEAAGQLGIATDDIVSFTEVIANLSATTNLTSDAAATQLAKFANITGLLSSEYENFGSVIVALGNNMATTESDIMNMSMRIAAAGTQVGLSQSSIAGFAAALSSLGLEAEAGGTAFSTALKKIQIAVETGSEDLEKFASVAGMTTEAFAGLWNTDVEAAITAFITGLGNVDDQSESTIALLEDIGFSGIRVSDTWTRLSNASPLVAEALEIASTAFAENSALAEEAALRYETVESKITILNNAFDQLKATVGQDLLNTIEPGIDILTQLTSAINDAAEASPALSSAFAAVTAALASFTAIAGVTAALGAIKGAIAALGTTAAATVGAIGGIVAALAAVIAAIAVYKSDTKSAANDSISSANKIVKSVDEISEAYKTANDNISKNQSETTALIEELERLISVENKTASEKQRISDIVDILNTSLPNLGLSYDGVTDSLNMSTTALEDWATAAYEAQKASEAKDTYFSAFSANANIEDEKSSLKEQINYYSDLISSLEDKYSGYLSVMGGIFGSFGDEILAPLDLQAARESLDLLTKKYDELVSKQDENNATMKEAGTVYDSYNESLADTADAYDNVKKSGNSANNTISETGDSADDASDSIDDLKDRLSELQDEYDDVNDGIQSVYDGLVTALKNQASAILKASKESNKQWYEAEKSASEERIAIYKSECDEKIRLLEESTTSITSALQDQIDAINALTDAEAAAADEQKWQDKLSGYDSDIAAALTDVSSYGLSGTLSEYEEKEAALVEEYSKKIADAEASKTKAVAAAQAEIDRISTLYADKLSSLESDSEEYAKAQYKYAEDLATANSELIAAQYGGDENISATKKAQADAEISLAKEKNAALLAAAESLGASDASITGKYNSEKLSIEEEYAEKISEIRSSTSKTEEEKLESINKLEKKQTDELYKLKQDYEDDLASSQEKRQKNAIEAVNDLYDLEYDRASDVGEYEYDNVLKIRDERIKSLEAQAKVVEDAAAALQARYDEIYANQKSQEEESLAAIKTEYEARDNAAQAYYDSYSAEQTALKMLAEDNQVEILKMLESYNPDWANAGRSAAVMLTDGWYTSADAYEDAVKGSVNAALSYLGLLGNEIDIINGKIDDLENGTEKISKETSSSGSLAVNEKYLATIEQYGYAAGQMYGNGLSLGLIDGTESVEKAAQILGYAIDRTVKIALDEKSPSKKGIESGNYYDEGIIIGLRGRIGEIEKASDEISNAVMSAMPEFTDTSVRMASVSSPSIGSNVDNSNNSRVYNMSAAFNIDKFMNDGENINTLVDRIMVLINDRLKREGAVTG